MPCEDSIKFSMVEKVKEILEKFDDIEVCDVDGVRVTSKYGWWLIRASNTQAIIVARCEASSNRDLETVKMQLKEVLKKIQIPYPEF